MNTVFLLLFQNYRFPRIQQGTGNQGDLCITMHFFPLAEIILFVCFWWWWWFVCFSRACHLLVIIIVCVLRLKKMTVFPDIFLYYAHRRKPFYMMVWNVF